MTASVAPPEMPASLIANLRDAVLAMGTGRYAVLDGLYDRDLRAKLDAAALTGLPLYRDSEGGGDIWAGPVLIDLAASGHAVRFMETVEAARAAVFWEWPDAKAALHRHLRTLNMARLPAEPSDGIGSGSAKAEELVLFRHYDPDALAPILPVLAPAQQARFLGNARGLIFAAEDYGGIVPVPRPDRMPPPASGPLCLDDGQLARVESLRTAASHRRIARFLHGELPHVGIDQMAMLARVPGYDGQARSLGLSTEGDIARWGYLQLISNETLFDMPSLQDSFRPEVRNRPASEFLDNLYDGIIEELRRRG